jgi:hypothetical protein
MIDFGREYPDADAWVDEDGTVRNGNYRLNGTAPAALESGERNSWARIDLGPYVRGQVHRPQPTVGLARTDGLRLLYPGKEHTVIGEMEAGKSWFALGCAAAELNAGNQVVYLHFEEADPGDTVDRLLELGVRDQDILLLFHFVGPERRSHLGDLAGLLNPVPTLVVLDGVNEAMALHGWGIRDEDGAAAYRRCLVKPCTRSGAAVLSLDHVVKDADRRTRSPLGSIHKGNGLTGSLIELVNAEPFGRGQRGRSHVFVNKDRPGHLRRNGRPGKVPGVTFMGELVIDDTHRYNPFLELIFHSSAAEQPATETAVCDTDDDKVYAAVLKVDRAGKPTNVRNVRAVTGVSNMRTSDALTRLAMADRLEATPGPYNSTIYTPTGGSHDQIDP